MEEYWIWLSSLKYVSPVLQKSLLEKFGSPKSVFEADKLDLEDVPQITRRAIQSIMTNKSLKNAYNILEEARKKDIKLLSLDNPNYPSAPLNCPESPILLYYKGILKNIDYAIGVVGSRQCTVYGKKVAVEVGKELAKRQVPVISGFSKGIESYAQTSSIQNGGYSIVLLANGVDICYPKEQRKLYEQMLGMGNVFISQYPPGVQADFKYFLQRNALISAWSNELIIVEATEDSGALWTVKFSKRNGRRVYAVPNQIGIPEGVGTNSLIASGEAIPYLGLKSLDSIHSFAYLIQRANKR